MPTFKLSRKNIESFKTVLPMVALLAIAKSVDAAFEIMCDPTIDVARKSPFGETSIYGIPVWFAVFAPLGLTLAILEVRFSAVARFFARYGLTIFIVCEVASLVVPWLHFPYRVLGACRS